MSDAIQGTCDRCKAKGAVIEMIENPSITLCADCLQRGFSTIRRDALPMSDARETAVLKLAKKLALTDANGDSGGYDGDDTRRGPRPREAHRRRRDQDS